MTLNEMAEMIERMMNSDDDIDRTYLLEAVVADLRAIGNGETATSLQELEENPIS